MSNVIEKTPIRVCVTGAAGNIAYSLLWLIATGHSFGVNQPLQLTLLDIPVMKQKMDGVMMEINDCSFPLVRGVATFDNPVDAFRDIDQVVCVGSKPRGPGMERQDLLKDNGKIFVEQGKALEKSAKKSVKVIVVGNPCNTNCLVAMKNAPSIPKENFSAMTMLDHTRCTQQVADKIGLSDKGRVRNVVIFGNHSAKQVPVVDQAQVGVTDQYRRDLRLPIKGQLSDDWVRKEMIPRVCKRGAEIIKVRGGSSVASAAHAASAHLRALHCGNHTGEWFSMGVFSNGQQGTPKDIIQSFPVLCEGNGKYTIVEDLNVDKQADMLKGSADELLEERKLALGY